MWKRPRPLHVRAVRFTSAHLTAQNSRDSLKAFGPFLSSRIKRDELKIPVKMVLTSLKQLDINKATGSDGISVHLLQETADQIAPSLTMLFNKSLRLGIFPGDWKLAKIIPIFKKGKRDFVENYRPISLLPVISKRFPSAAFWWVYGIIYPTSSVANSMAF